MATNKPASTGADDKPVTPTNSTNSTNPTIPAQVETKIDHAAAGASAGAGATATAAPSTIPEGQPQTTNLTGRAVFAVETTAAGVVVRTAFLTEDNRLMDMPAIFPDMMYALNVIDDLRRQVMQHFSQAAQVGAQVIANQARSQQQQQQQQQAGAQTTDENTTTIKG